MCACPPASNGCLNMFFHMSWLKKLSLEQNLFSDEAVRVLALWRPLHGLQVLFIVFAIFLLSSLHQY
jgi:hypothetical protein